MEGLVGHEMMDKKLWITRQMETWSVYSIHVSMVQTTRVHMNLYLHPYTKLKLMGLINIRTIRTKNWWWFIFDLDLEPMGFLFLNKLKKPKLMVLHFNENLKNWTQQVFLKPKN